MTSDTFPFNELRLLLEKARAADPQCKKFGADHHKYQWNPPASLDEVEKFEQEIGTTLPQDYRDFLLQAGNGGAGPYYGLFCLEQVRGWLGWQVEPGRTPQISPQIKEWSADDPDNWKRGCIPIESQGDTCFACLMVAGPDRGRVFYMEYEGSWIFFPREPDFLSWYRRWLREMINGYNIFWFGTNLDGDEAALRQHYAQAADEKERLLVIESMEKFPSFSEETKAFLSQVIHERLTIPDAQSLLKLTYRVGPELYHQFLDKRWEAGLYSSVLSELHFSLYHVPIERTVLANRWKERVLAKLLELPRESDQSALFLLSQSKTVTIEQAAPLLEKAEGGSKCGVLRQLRRFPNADQRVDIWFPSLEQRENLDVLEAAILSVPRVNDARLRAILMEIQSEFSSAVELPIHMKPKTPEERERYSLCSKKYNIYQAACTAWRDALHEAVNPAVVGIPRPYHLEIRYCDIQDLGMNQTPLPDGIPIHPMIALAILEERGRLPATAYDWRRLLERIKRLSFRLHQSNVRAWDDENRSAILRWPNGHFPPSPYYYALYDWSAIGRMKNLQNLSIKEICVDDFSFLAQCKNLQTLSLYNTNFTDCRLLLEMPQLKSVDLRLCRLSYKEVLAGLPLKCQF